jgi:hypothetical protein
MERPTSQGSYVVDYERRGLNYLKELNAADVVTDTMRERGNEIKRHLGGNIKLLLAIIKRENAIDQRNARGNEQPAARRNLFG